jgi:hypothetical protein
MYISPRTVFLDFSMGEQDNHIEPAHTASQCKEDTWAAYPSDAATPRIHSQKFRKYTAWRV